jgi:hypothetical protein
MAVTWSKIYTSGDTVPIDDGGTGTTEIVQGAVVSDGAALSGVPLAAGQLLVGAGAGTNPAGSTFANTSDVVASGTPGAFLLNIQPGVVEHEMMANDAIDWVDNMLKTATGATKGTVPYFDAVNGDPQIVSSALDSAGSATADGYVLMLKSVGGHRDPYWESASSVTASVGYTNVEDEASNPKYAVALRHSSSTLGFDAAGGGTSDHPLEWDPTSHTLTAKELAGNAATATKVLVTANGVSGAKPVLFSDVGNANANVYSRTGFTYNPGTDELVVPNLRVSGDTTTLNVTNLDVEDSIMRLNQAQTPNGTLDDTSAIGSGIIAAVTGAYTAQLDASGNSTADSVLPKIKYSGIADLTSPSGWKVAKSKNASLSADVSEYGVSVMTVTATQTGDDVALSGAQVDALNIGVGALQFSASGLYIQTSA